MTTYDLPCRDGRKSFYGKARVTENGDLVTLTSYHTNICTYDRSIHTLTKLDPVATATTRRHVRSFLAQFGLAPMDNDTWDRLPLHTPVDVWEEASV